MPLRVPPTVPFAFCVVGLLIAAASLLPAWSGPTSFPFPLFLGAGIYLLAGFVVMASANREEQKKFQLWMRFVRIGFVAVFLVALLRITPGS